MVTIDNSILIGDYIFICWSTINKNSYRSLKKNCEAWLNIDLKKNIYIFIYLKRNTTNSRMRNTLQGSLSIFNSLYTIRCAQFINLFVLNIYSSFIKRKFKAEANFGVSSYLSSIMQLYTKSFPFKTRMNAVKWISINNKFSNFGKI